MPDTLIYKHRRPEITIFKLPVFIFLVIIGSCSPHEDQTREPERWTSSDPLAIPLRAREQKYKLGNLVFNPSFELGKVLFSDSQGSTNNIEGWSIVGKNVTWIHGGNGNLSSDSTEVYSGKGSIRIDRSDAGETEAFGYGVLSDYIKVIPGNYLLSLRINLKDIENPKARLGVRLYDALDIKLIHYDKNRIKIDADFDAPYYKTQINNSFKGTSLANFTTIDSSGWMHIIGKSHQFPFPDGDLQDDTKFVRIFIGLKGNGTLWVDDVSFKYTRYNFTNLERIKPYFDSTLVKSNLIIPQPRKVEILESLIYYRPYYKNEFPIILIPEQADPLIQEAAILLEKRIKHLLLKHTELQEADVPSLIRSVINGENLEKAMIFSLGNTSLAKKYADDLPLDKIKPSSKAYFIYSFPEESNVIFLYGNQPTGNFFAAQVASQLFDDKRLIFHNANVLDYPAREDYAILLLNYSELADVFIATAHETRFCEIYLPGLDRRAHEISGTASHLQSLTRWVYYPWSWKGKDALCSSVVSDIRKLDDKSHNLKGVALLKVELLEKGSLTSMLEPEEFPARRNEENPRIKDLIHAVREKHLQLEIMPEMDNNPLLVRALNNPFSLSRIMEFDDIPMIWSANQFFTWRVDEGDLAFYNAYLKSPKVFLDLTLYPRSEKFNYFAADSVWPYKLQTACLFEPYTNEVLPGVYQQVEKTLVGFELVTEFDRIRLQTASDFFWNPAGYNPDLSLYRALVSEYGEQLAQDLIYFNDYYFKLKSELILAHQLKNYNKHQRKIAAHLKEIDLIKERIRIEAENLNHPKLMESISSLLDKLKADILRNYPVLLTE